MRKREKVKQQGSILAIILVIITVVLTMSSAYAFLNVRLAINGSTTIEPSATCNGDLTATVRFEKPWTNENKLRTIANFTVTNNSDQPIDNWYIHVVGATDMVITKYNDNSGIQANSSGVIDVQPYDYNQVIAANGEIQFGFMIDSVGDPIIIRSISIGECELVSNISLYSDGTITGIEEPSSELTALAIVPNSIQMEVGDTTNFTYSKTPADATNVLTWSTTDTNIISIDNNGFVTALAIGTATIHLNSDNNIEATATVNVVEHISGLELTQLSITPNNHTLTIGDTYNLSLTKTPANATNTITWSSSDTSVVTVDSNGTITAVSAGNATITATSDNNLTATSQITVTGSLTPTELTDFTISPSTLTMTAGESVLLNITKTPANATESFYFSSWNPNVATIDSNGRVTAVSNGTATINIQSTNNIQKQITVRVISVIDPSDVALNLVCTASWGTTCQYDLQLTNNNLSVFNTGVIEINIPTGSSIVCWNGTIDGNHINLNGTYEPGQVSHIYGQITFPEGTNVEDGMSAVTYSFISGE